MTNKRIIKKVASHFHCAQWTQPIQKQMLFVIWVIQKPIDIIGRMREIDEQIRFWLISFSTPIDMKRGFLRPKKESPRRGDERNSVANFYFLLTKPFFMWMLELIYWIFRRLSAIKIPQTDMWQEDRHDLAYEVVAIKVHVEWHLCESTRQTKRRR